MIRDPDKLKGPGMGQIDTSSAFARAMQNADCETLIAQIGEWFDKPYRDPTNALDIAVCVQSAAHTYFSRKIDEARRNWRTADAADWEASRKAFDAAMIAAVEALGRQPNPDPATPQHDWTPQRSDSKWGNPNKRPAIGAGWGRPVHA
jgi:hypothetical protein